MSARSLDLNGKMNLVTLSSCGWRTPTTKVAINNCLAQLGFSEKISQKKGIWYIGDQVFFDGYTIRSNK